jgi:L-arabinonolactonase
MSASIEPVCDLTCDLGESPLWSVQEQRLYWVDITQRRIYRLDPSTGKLETVVVARMPAAIALHRPGSLLVAYRTGIAVLDLATGSETELPNAIDFGKERFNDGKTDRRGRFFVGTMDRKMEERIGGLYRVDAERKVVRVHDDVQLSNGIAWSPDNRTMYHCDSRPGHVFAYDYDVDSGTPSNRRIHIDLATKDHGADGCTVDAEGFLWLAEVGSGHVGRYAPDGRRVGEIQVPAKRVASVMFGGKNLDTLYIITLRYNVATVDLQLQPLAGRMFATRPGVTGLPETHYAG